MPGIPRRFALLLVKPSHYDDDGYVIQWFRSAIPSNSLAALYGLAQDCAARRVLGDDIAIDIHAFDETNTRIRPDRLARMIEDAGAGMVMLVGVQSKQFPRALDIARPLRRRGIAVGIGGFHVSGTVAMLGGVDPDLARAEAIGVSLFAGEAEGRLDEVLRDAFAGRLKPHYNYMDDLPGIEGAPIPLLPRERVKRTAGAVTRNPSAVNEKNTDHAESPALPSWWSRRAARMAVTATPEVTAEMTPRVSPQPACSWATRTPRSTRPSPGSLRRLPMPIDIYSRVLRSRT